MLKLLRKEKKFPFSAEALQQFPEHSLGHDLVCFLDKKDLHLLPYYARHDIKHILLNYDTTEEGEVCLQCFMLGNRHISFPVIATVLYGCTMPEYWSSFRKAFKRGRQASYISDWNWYSILHKPTEKLRAQIDNK
jgi:ubiquinone biosynthesis protein Coq4